ncbi:HI1506-related protein [Dongia sp.]|uniref:HI1506-related protein n=1 Tax=Dongia sp. TaxID=1977262 RepID=UPI0035B45239
MKMLRITAKKDGFRRAGVEHSSAPAEHKAEDFTAKQIEAMKAEPMLVVEEFEGKPPKEEKK